MIEELEKITRAGSELAYPEGWFQVAYSDELGPGDVQAKEYFGRKLVLFRTEDGKAQVLDAFCAHLGAHLGVGGTVVGDRIVCPFHGWEYGTDGKCSRIPYGDLAPPRSAAMDVWPTEERSGLILIWHSPDGAAPKWEPPVLAEYGVADWGTYFLKRHFRFRSTLHEIVENIADPAHTLMVHGAPGLPDVQYTFEDHRFRAIFHNDLPSVGHKAINDVTAHGLGIVENRSSGAGQKAFFSTYTPINRDLVDVWFSMLAKKNSSEDPTGAISRSSAQATISEFEKDIPIWEAKLFRKNPLVVPADGPIARYRAWARQFY